MPLVTSYKASALFKWVQNERLNNMSLVSIKKNDSVSLCHTHI